MKKKLFLIAASLVIFSLVFNFSVSNAETMSVTDLQALIEALQEQIAQLQHQLNEIQTQSEVWCHDFEVNLRYGDRGPEVSALQAALKKEGFTISEKEIKESYFGDWTAAAVVGFQEKYKEDILTPWGLEHGTGFVGLTTRAKLNELYGCKGVSPVLKPVVLEPHEIPPTTKPSIPTPKSITLISPNGGERWEVGKTYTIRWEAPGYTPDTSVQIALRVAGVDPNLSSGEATIANTKNTGSYTWKIPAQLEGMVLGAGNVYKIIIRIAGGGPGKYDLSDEYFSIVSTEESCHTSPLWSWDYCSPTCPCSEGEGDCDTDDDCQPGLYCAQNVGAKYGQASLIDVCERKEEKSITLISPNGGERWEIGESYEVTWESKGVKNVNILLIDFRAPKRCYLNPLFKCSINGGRKCTPVPLKAEDGRLVISSLATVECYSGMGEYKKVEISPGDQYKIRIEDADNPSISDESDDYFSIGEEKHSITLISPNGGERWEIGESYDITWVREGEFEKIVVELARYPEKGLPEYKLLGTFDGRTALYRWTITSDVAPDDKYKIKVSGHTSDGRVISDESDGYFSIVEVKKGELSCSDTDGGKNYYEKGEVTVQGLGYQTTFIDFCQDSTLNEGYCENNDIQAIKYRCPYFCKNGRCVAPLVCNSYGDMDNDGYITKEDVDILFELVDKAVSEEQKKKGDVNGNGEIDFDDIVKLNSYLKGEIDTLPVCEE